MRIVTTKTFLTIGDILACWVFSAVLGLLAMSGIWLYAHTPLFSADDMKELATFVGPAAGLEVGLLCYQVGTVSPHLRTTQADLWAYFVRFARLVLLTEAIVIPIHLVCSLVIRYLHFNGGFVLTLLCLGLGWLILYYSCLRTFIWGGLPQADPKPVRGQDLQSSDEVEKKAWWDD